MSRVRQIAIFLSIFALILGIGHFYLFERIGYYLALSAQARVVAGTVLAVLAIMTLVSLPLSRVLPRWAASLLAWIVYPWMGIAFLLLAAFMVTDIVWILLNLVPPGDLPEPYMVLQRCFGVVALSAVGAVAAFALWNGLRPVRVREVSVQLKRLPKSLDGVRLVQLTDLHIGPLIDGAWLRRIVERVNKVKPDLVVITGDLIDGTVQELGAHVAPLAELQAPVYFVTGNHEYYSGVEEWCALLEKMGVRVLRNARAAVTAGSAGESFDLAGVDDWASGSFPGEGPDLQKALAGRDESRALVLLAHQPAAADEAAAAGVDLQLSGHTHGGQIWPFTYLVYLQQPYTQGLFRHKDTALQVYVSPGTGFWGPPMRLGTLAEITHITLRSGV